MDLRWTHKQAIGFSFIGPWLWAPNWLPTLMIAWTDLGWVVLSVTNTDYSWCWIVLFNIWSLHQAAWVNNVSCIIGKANMGAEAAVLDQRCHSIAPGKWGRPPVVKEYDDKQQRCVENTEEHRQTDHKSQTRDAKFQNWSMNSVATVYDGSREFPFLEELLELFPTNPKAEELLGPFSPFDKWPFWPFNHSPMLLNRIITILSTQPA